MLVVDLDQLEGGARAKALALGARHVGIVELALEPELREDCDLRLSLTRTLSSRSPRPLFFAVTARRHGCAPDAVLAHHLHQHAFAQAAVGDAQPLARKRAADRFEDGAAGEHQVGALGADAGIGDAAPRSSWRAAARPRRSPASSLIQQPSTRRRS